jgi:hypothetical protein
MDNVPPIMYQPMGNTHWTSPVPPGVSIEGEMLGKVVFLKFMDHDITNEKNSRSWPGKNICTLGAYQAQEKSCWRHRSGRHDWRRRHTELVGDSTFWVKLGD